MMETNATLPSEPAGQAAGMEIEDIRGVKPPVAIPSVWEWLGPVLLGLAVALVVLWLLRWWWRRRLKGPAVVEVVVPAHVRARERLREALGLIGEPKPFCIAISLGLRVYLEERFDLRAPDRTTEEFLDELQSSARLSASQKERLGDFLIRCDLVKFARHEPGEPALRELFDAAMRLVDETAEEVAEVAEVGDTGGDISR